MVANFLQRAQTTIRAAARAWNGVDNSVTSSSLNTLRWDSAGTRIERYKVYQQYYENNIYFNPAILARLQMMRPPLYKHIRGVFNPVNRLSRLYVSKVYPGGLDMETLSGGAVPLNADDRLKEAIRQVWIWSNWQSAKSLYVRYGTIFGDSAIKVIDNPESGKVRMEVLDPRKIADVEVDAVGNVKRIVIEYDKVDERGKTYTYTEVIDGNEFVTYRDNEEHAYFTDASGTAVSRWSNEYGFVPVVLAKHTLTGGVFGEPSFADYLSKIDEINDQASLLNDQIRKSIVPMFFASGVRGVDKLKAESGDRDEITVITGGEGSTMTAIVGSLDIAAASDHLQHLFEELERDLPELFLARQLETGNVTATAVRAAASPGVSRIQEAQSNYDDALVRAQMMCISIGGYRKYPGFAGYSLDSYARGDLLHFVGERPVIADDLSKFERIQATQAAGASMALQLRQLGYDEATIEDEEARKQERSANEVSAFAKSLFGDEEADDEELIDEEATQETEAV